jgi:hypothetical protein
LIPELFPVNPGDWRDEAKKALDKEVIINGVCVMNQSSDFKSDEGEDVNMEQNENGDESDAKSTAADGNDEDEIKKSFIKKPSMEMSESGDDVKVKKEVDESSAWEY